MDRPSLNLENEAELDGNSERLRFISPRNANCVINHTFKKQEQTADLLQCLKQDNSTERE